MQEKVLAETKLVEVADYRLVRTEVGDYCTEYAEGERSARHSPQSFLQAMVDFRDAVVQDAIDASEREPRDVVHAEATIADGAAVIRVIRTEVGDYYTEYAEGERSAPRLHHSLLKAMAAFEDAVVQEEISTWAAGVRA
ncbi:MAG: hypothetical protein M3P49_03765 [Actinomycetota bacterium]|nr:hypothetical protein [Actinomycetota bacterium]